MDAAFRTEMADGYRLDEPSILLGSPMLGDEVLTEVRVQLALARVNRHGLIAGATGTGRTGDQPARLSCSGPALEEFGSVGTMVCVLGTYPKAQARGVQRVKSGPWCRLAPVSDCLRT